MAHLNVVKYPKSILHEFYQKVQGTPTYVTEAVGTGVGEPRFRSIVTCPGFRIKDVDFAERSFDGEARAKKQAEHMASEAALEHFRELGVLPAVAPPVVQAPAVVANNGKVTLEELVRFRDRIITLAAQMEGLADVGELAATTELQADVDNLPEDEVRQQLKGAFLEIRNLRAALERERGNRKAALLILTGAEGAENLAAQNA